MKRSNFSQADLRSHENFVDNDYRSREAFKKKISFKNLSDDRKRGKTQRGKDNWG